MYHYHQTAVSPIDNLNHTYIPLELRDRKAIRSLVSTWRHGSINTVILNAGMWARDAPLFDKDGVEETFSVNLVNQALLFFLLSSSKHLAPDYRVITISSQLHDPKYASAKGDLPAWVGSAGVASAKDKRLANPATRYTTSKLGNVMFGYALHRHIQRGNGNTKRAKAIVYDPSFVPGTGLTRGEADCLYLLSETRLIFLGADVKPHLRFVANYILPNILPLFRRMTGMQTSTPELAGQSMAALAQINSTGQSGEYIVLGKPDKSSEESYDVAKQEELWNWLVDTLAKDDSEKRSFAAV